MEEEHDIVIVGAGICGLATAFALFREGLIISSGRMSVVVLEKAESLRTEGAGIAIFTNGWRALHQLGVASELRSTAMPIQSLREISLDDDGSVQTIPLGKEELRCLRRSDLIGALGNNLPDGMVRFGCQVITVELDPLSSRPMVYLRDGSVIGAKVVIGCDGANSVVAESIGLKPAKCYSTCSTVGFTNYMNGHGFENESIRMRRGSISVGRIPVDDNLVYWFVAREWPSTQGSNAFKDQETIRRSAEETVESFPSEIKEMVENSDLNSLTTNQLKYRVPWEILTGSFRKGTIFVAGDAMHVMGPFLGQGASAGLEDAIVLARCFAQTAFTTGERIELAIDKFLKERRKRLMLLSTQTYVIGLLSEPSSTRVIRFLCIVILSVLFGNPLGHAQYDCGYLFYSN